LYRFLRSASRNEREEGSCIAGKDLITIYKRRTESPWTPVFGTNTFTLEISSAKEYPSIQVRYLSEWGVKLTYRTGSTTCFDLNDQPNPQRLPSIRSRTGQAYSKSPFLCERIMHASFQTQSETFNSIWPSDPCINSSLTITADGLRRKNMTVEEAVEAFCTALRRRQIEGSLPTAKKTTEILRLILTTRRHADGQQIVDEIRSWGTVIQSAKPSGESHQVPPAPLHTHCQL